MNYTVSQVAKLTGITQRTLRYYDGTGLLTPSKRSEAGYRCYSGEDLKKLQKILFFKEMDFPLDKIALLIEGSQEEQIQALALQKVFLHKCAARYERLARLAADTIEEMKGMKTMNQEERFEPFKENNIKQFQTQYEQEVKEQWGGTQAYQTAAKRTKGYDKEKWNQIMKEQKENMETMAQYMNQGFEPNDDKVQALVEVNRLWIDRHFYPCSKEMMGSLGQLYISDERFTKTYEDIAQGLADYYHKAIEHYLKG